MGIGNEHHEHGERRRRHPETLRLRAVMPVLRVSDLERSLAWYRDVMGFVVAEELRDENRPAAVQLKAGKVRFLLEQDAAQPGGARGAGIELYCATRQDVHRLVSAIQERGGRIEQARSDGEGGQDFAVVDPDGYRISVFWRPDA